MSSLPRSGGDHRAAGRCGDRTCGLLEDAAARKLADVIRAAQGPWIAASSASLCAATAIIRVQGVAGGVRMTSEQWILHTHAVIWIHFLADASLDADRLRICAVAIEANGEKACSSICGRCGWCGRARRSSWRLR